MGTKISIHRISNVLDDPLKPDGTFHPSVDTLIDKLYPEFNGHMIDICFSNMVLNRQHKKQDNGDQLEKLDQKDFHKILFEVSKAKEILSIN